MRNLLDDEADERPQYGHEAPSLLLDSANGDGDFDSRESRNLLADRVDDEER